ncbi:lysostaphin resistance A-like protein [Lacticaseibacillus pantheris]|jgi:membrane protease YdiL (CAAX protease family)
MLQQWHQRTTAGKITILACFIVLEGLLDLIVIPIGIKSIGLPSDFSITLAKVIELGVILGLNALMLRQRFYWRGMSRRSIITVAICLTIWCILMGVGKHSWSRVGTGILIGLLAAIPEETMYRGVVLGNLIRVFSGKHRVGVALWVSTFLFALAHVSNISSQSAYVTLCQVVQVLGLGLLLGVFYLRSGSLLASMAMHFGLDYTVTVLNGFTASSADHTRLISSVIISAIYGLIALAVYKGAHHAPRLITTNDQH